MSSLNKQVYSGVQWITLSTITLVITQMVSTAVLVRLLDKSDFGLMALVMVVKGFADIFMDFGITVAILHKQDMSQNQYSSLYWLNMFAGIIIYVVICLISPLIASFYHKINSFDVFGYSVFFDRTAAKDALAKRIVF